MPLKTIDQIDDADAYKSEMIRDLKRDIPSPQKFFYFVEYKGKKKTDKNARGILMLAPYGDSALTEMKKLAKKEIEGTYVINPAGKLVFTPPNKAKAIAKTLGLMGLKDRVQLADGESEGDEHQGSETTGTTSTPTSPTTTPPPQTRPRSDSTPPPSPPPVTRPTPPQSTVTPPPPVSRPTAPTPTPITPQGTRPPGPTIGSRPTPPTPPVTRPTPPQSTATPPPVPPKPSPTGPTSTGFKPGTPPPPTPQGTGPTIGSRPTPTSTTTPTTGTAPQRPTTPLPQDDSIEGQTKRRFAELKVSVAEFVKTPSVPPLVKAAAEKSLKLAEIYVTGKNWAKAGDEMKKIEEALTQAGIQATAPQSKASSEAEKEIVAVLGEIKTLLDEITGEEVIPAGVKTKLASDYKAAIALRDLKQYEKALEAFRKVKASAEEAIANKTTPQTKQQSEEEKKLTPKERLREQQVADKLLDTQIEADILLSDNDIPEIQEIMAEQRAYVPREMNAFRGFRTLEDIGRIRNPGRRQKALEAMNSAFASATDREQRFVAAMAKIKDKNSDAYKSALEIRAKLLAHIPEGFESERKSLGKRLDVLAMDPDEKKKELTEMLKIKNPDPALKKELDEERDAIMAAIEHGSLKSGDRTQFYFDAPVKSITKEQGAKMQAAYDKAIARAYKIRDLGGSPADAEAALAHIPPDFWPPALIDTMQAWRKVERELADERVADLFKKDPGFKLDKNTVKQGLKFVSELFSTLDDFKDLGGDISDFSDSVQHASDVIGGAQKVGSGAAKGLSTLGSVAGKVGDLATEVSDPLGNLDGLIKNDELADAVSALLDVAGELNDELLDKMKEGDFGGMTDKQLEQGSDWLDHMATAGSKIQMVIGKITDLKDAPGMDQTNFALHVCPVLSIIATGIDIGLAMKQLAREVQRRVQTMGLKTKAEVRHYSGEDWDGGALVSAFKNEIGQRDRNATKVSVDIAGKGVAMAGDITLVAASASPGGQGAGIALKVVGKGIQVGNKLVFTGIDWGIANKAKKLVAEARAGNPIARQQLFADSALYSKMYIAILAKEEHPLATKFLVQRQYEEKDIMNEAISLKVIREALLNDSGQKDEREVNDSFLGNYIDEYAGTPKKAVVGAGKLAVKGGKTVGKAVTDKVKGRATPYDETWRAPETACLDQASWDKVKADAIKAGLRDEPTGIGAALKKLSEAIAKEAAAQPPKKTELTFELIAEYQKAADVVGAAKPVTNDESKTHAGMLTFLAFERTALLTAGNRMREQLKNIGVINTKWKPSTGGVVTSAAGWNANWASAVKECHLDPDDAGVGKAWDAFGKAYLLIDAEPDKLKKRALQIKARDLLAPLTKALSLCWVGASEFESVRDYIDGEQNKLMALSRELDKTSFGGEWKGPKGSTPPVLKETEFNAIYDYAKQEGYVSAPNTVAVKLQALAKGAEDYAKLAPSPAKRQARDEQIKLISAAVKAIDDLAKKTGETHATFTAYLDALIATARATRVEMMAESQKVTFTAKPTVLPKDFADTIADAVAKGAIAKDDKKTKPMADALVNLQAGIAKVTAATKKSKKEGYKAFLEVAKLVEKAADAVTKLEDIDGGDNDTFRTFVEKLSESIRDLPKDNPSLKLYVDGSGVDDIAATPFTWKDADWQKLKKTAIANGLYPDAKTGIGESITSGEKAYKEFTAGKADAKKNQKLAQDALKAMTATDAMITTQVNRALMIKKDNLKKYWEEARTESQKRLEEIQQWIKDNPAPTKK